MPTAPAPAENALKAMFDAARYRSFAAELVALSPEFNRRTFLRLTLEGLDERELMDRLRQTAIAYHAAQPGDYPHQLRLLQQLAPRIGHSFIAIWLCEFVSRFGLDRPELSLEALRDFTRYGSAEFAIRPFLKQDLTGTLRVMQEWARDPNEHVRRLASEGSRPRLPWGARVPGLIADPEAAAVILESLKRDPSQYVRKSVANHLNDIAKDHPDWVVQRVSAWDRSDPGTAWIVRHGLRTLIKRGHAPALVLLGADPAAAKRVHVRQFKVAPARLRLAADAGAPGAVLTLDATLSSASARTERLLVDYVVHYCKARGPAAAKVFKWAVLDLAAGATAHLTKRQTVRDFTTRRHHAGWHRVELQVNGTRQAESGFELRR